MSIMEEIKHRIEKFEGGEVFTTATFNDISNITAVRKCLGRCVNDGLIRRVFDGVYEKPKFSKLLNEYLPTDPEKVAYAIANNCHWTIAPGEDVALNKLGLSTQVPAVWTYVSDGPYRQYAWNKVRIIFKHRTNREITRLSYQTILVIEALKTLGKEKVDSSTIAQLKKRFKDNDKEIILNEAKDCSEWIYKLLKEICRT